MLHHSLLEVVRNEDRGGAAEEGERRYTGVRPGLLPHVVGALRVELPREGQACREDADLERLPCVHIDDLHGVADVVHLHLLGGFVGDAHGGLVRHRPLAVPLAERRVHVGGSALADRRLAVLGPQEHHRHARTGHLGVNMIVVDLRLVGIGLGFGRIDHLPDGAIPHLLRQGPFDPSRLRSAGDGPDGGRGTSARESDVADADPHGAEPEDISVLDRSSSPVLSMVDRCFLHRIEIVQEKKGRLRLKTPLNAASRAASAWQRNAERRSSIVWNGVASQPR